MARARAEQAGDEGASEQTLSVSQARSAVIFETSTTSRVDSLPAWLSSGFCARAPRSRMDRLRRAAPICQPRAAEGKNEFCSLSSCFDESSEAVTPSAEPPIAEPPMAGQWW